MFVIFLLTLFYNFFLFNFSKFLVTRFCNLYYHFNYFVFLEIYLFNYHNNLNIFTKSFYYYDVYIFFIFFSIGLTLTIFLLFLSYFLSGSYFVISKSNKLKSYERGFDPIKSLGGTFKFNMQYFRIALIFLIFDLEILFLFP
jgi:NADH:ubiquinone oxidoreductase subunit 3 (subunit A)